MTTWFRPRLSADRDRHSDPAVAGTGQVFFVDAAHFVYGTFLCCLWSIVRVRLRAASGRQRFNVLSVWNAVTGQLLAVTNMIVVNTPATLTAISTTHAEALKSLMTLQFQTFEDVSLLTA